MYGNEFVVAARIVGYPEADAAFTWWYIFNSFKKIPYGQLQTALDGHLIKSQLVTFLDKLEQGDFDDLALDYSQLATEVLRGYTSGLR